MSGKYTNGRTGGWGPSIGVQRRDNLEKTFRDIDREIKRNNPRGREDGPRAKFLKMMQQGKKFDEAVKEINRGLSKPAFSNDKCREWMDER